MRAARGDQHAGSEPLDRGRRLAQVVDAGQLAGFGVVDLDDVHAAQHAAQLVGRDLDPQVHRVHADEALALDLVEHALLQQRVHVAQKDDVGLLVGRGQLGLEALEDVELGEQRLAAIEVQAVLAAPAERLAFGVLNTLQVDASTTEQLELFLAEVFADDGDQVDVGEERSEQGEVGRASRPRCR